MKNISIMTETAISALMLFTIGTNHSFAQTNGEALGFSDGVESNISDFEKNASDIQTNESILDSQKAMDQDMGGAENAIKSAINSLHFSQINMNREKKAILWFEILAALDRHAGKIPGSQIGYLPPPPGYKGKVGMDGMEMPDTNDAVDYKIYVAAVRARRKNSMEAGFQYMLQRENEWEATPYAEKYFRSCYTSEADKREFENLLDQSKLSDARKKALREAVGVR